MRKIACKWAFIPAHRTTQPLSQDNSQLVLMEVGLRFESRRRDRRKLFVVDTYNYNVGVPREPFLFIFVFFEGKGHNHSSDRLQTEIARATEAGMMFCLKMTLSYSCPYDKSFCYMDISEKSAAQL